MGPDLTDSECVFAALGFAVAVSRSAAAVRTEKVVIVAALAVEFESGQPSVAGP